IPNVICSSSQKPVVFCDDMNGKYSSLAGNLNLNTYEFPIMATATASSTAAISDLTLPKLMHPCLSLSSVNNYKNQVFDIFNYGEFATTVCERQCAHFVDALRFECGDRRPSPTWNLGSTLGEKRKINCSDWAIPLTQKGIEDGISLTSAYATYSSSNGQNYTPPYTLDDLSIGYLDGMHIKGFHLKPVVDPALKDASLAEMESMLDMLTKKHPEIIHVAFGNQIGFFGDFYRNQSKYYAPRLIKLAMIKLDEYYKMILFGLLYLVYEQSYSPQICDNVAQTPSTMNRNLQAIGFYNVTMSSIPSWIQTDLLQFLEFSATLSDNTDISGLDNLPSLEHFLLTESELTKIKSPFLAKSTKLLSLTLQCNAINSIASGAFDHLTELKYLNLAGNQLVSLPENLLINLNNLLTLDLKALDNSSNTYQTYDEQIMQCQIKIKPAPTHPILDLMPKVPKPENIMALDIRGQPNFLKNNQKMLGDFKSLEILNLGNLGLTSIQNLSLEALCNLNDLNLVGNPLSDNQWLGEESSGDIHWFHHTKGWWAERAMVEGDRKPGGSAPKERKPTDAISTATMFGYKIKNISCQAYVKSAIDKIRAMELQKMETECQ
ncbi:Protein CBR-LRON-4, partial [Caenorhabditis briggsae]